MIAVVSHRVRGPEIQNPKIMVGACFAVNLGNPYLRKIGVHHIQTMFITAEHAFKRFSGLIEPCGYIFRYRRDGIAGIENITAEGFTIAQSMGAPVMDRHIEGMAPGSLLEPVTAGEGRHSVGLSFNVDQFDQSPFLRRQPNADVTSEARKVRTLHILPTSELPDDIGARLMGVKLCGTNLNDRRWEINGGENDTFTHVHDHIAVQAFGGAGP